MKLIVILGPTATGKSDLAVTLARKIKKNKNFCYSDVEIISADSRQVYKGLDIGTGKITKKEMRGITHYMLDIISPSRVFSAGDYVKKVEKILKEMKKKNTLPIIVGGTGFYVSTLLGELVLPEVKSNQILRKKLENKSLEELSEELKKLDKRRWQTIDVHNKVRLIRAIEIASVLGNVPKPKKIKKFNVLKIGITSDKKVLKERIETRLKKRIKIGMIKEAQDLHHKGLSFKRMEELGLEYKYLSYYLQKKLTKSELIDTLGTKINQYAKRQLTWFKRDKETNWITTGDTETAFALAKSFLKCE